MSCRTEGGFGERIWEEIDRATGAVKAASCTARQFLEVDGPYGFGLTSVAGSEQLTPFSGRGASAQNWNVLQPQGLNYGAAPHVSDDGTYLVTGPARAVPLIASGFSLGMRAITAYDSQCQPLDLCPAVNAARDVALEEERLIYYGFGDDKEALLTIHGWTQNGTTYYNVTQLQYGELFDGLRRALYALTQRGYAGPFALAAEPFLYSELYTPVTRLNNQPLGTPVLLVDLLRAVFRGGIYLVPVINSNSGSDPNFRTGAIVTVGRAYSRLVVGQDWYTAYRGRDGVLHNFLLISSLQLRICDPRSIQVLTLNYDDGLRQDKARLEKQYDLKASGDEDVITHSSTGQSAVRAPATAQPARGAPGALR